LAFLQSCPGICSSSKDSCLNSKRIRVNLVSLSSRKKFVARCRKNVRRDVFKFWLQYFSPEYHVYLDVNEGSFILFHSLMFSNVNNAGTCTSKKICEEIGLNKYYILLNYKCSGTFRFIIYVPFSHSWIESFQFYEVKNTWMSINNP